MKSMISALIAAVLMAAGSPVSAAMVLIPDTPSMHVVPLGTLGDGSTPLEFTARDIPVGADYVSDTTWSFTISSSFALSASVLGDEFSEDNPMYKELHLALFSQSPTTEPHALYANDTVIGNLIDINTIDLGALGFITGGNSTNSASISAPSLSPGTYYLRVWGLTEGPGEGYSSIGGSGTLPLLTAVPLPAAAWLFLSGLGGLGAVRARRRSRQGVVA